MSVRTVRSETASNATEIQSNLAALKETALAQTRADAVAAAVPEGAEVSAAFEALAPHEQAAASLGVHPESWKPIGFMNNSHFETLLKENALDSDLARRIEAYRTVASQDSA